MGESGWTLAETALVTVERSIGFACTAARQAGSPVAGRPSQTDGRRQTPLPAMTRPAPFVCANRGGDMGWMKSAGAKAQNLFDASLPMLAGAGAILAAATGCTAWIAINRCHSLASVAPEIPETISCVAASLLLFARSARD